MILACTFLSSAASLALEVLFARFLSITQWNQMSFLVLSVALLGYGASGTLVSLAERHRPRAWGERHVVSAALGYSVVSLAAFALVAHLPMDCFRIPMDRRQLGYLICTFLLLSLPFFFSGLAVSLGYVVRPGETRRIYLASMIGSGLGALAPLLLVPLVGETGAFLACALLPAPSLLLVRRGWTARLAAALLVAASGVLAVTAPSLWSYELSPYKKLSQLRLSPDTSVVETNALSYGRVAVAASPALRFAPGLSLLHADRLPGRDAVFLSGEAMIVIPSTGSGSGSAPETLSSHYAAAYLLAPPAPRALIAEQSGGLAILAALEAGAASVDVVVSLPGIARYIAERYGDARVRVLAESARALLARSADRWDLIHIDDWGSSIPGMDSLSQLPLFTRDACSAGLRRLSDRGVLVFARVLLLPPVELVRLLANLAEAFRQEGMGSLDGHLAVLRSWDSYSILVSRSPLTGLQCQAIRDFCARLRFDLVHLPGLAEAEANRYNRLPEPAYYRAARDLLAAYGAGNEGAYLRSLSSDAAPQGDERPFHNRYTRLRDLLGLLVGPAGPYSILLSGEAIVAIVFAVALFVGAPLALVPLLLRPTSRRLGGRSTPARAPWKTFLYFGAVGLGFMAAETAFLQAFEVLFPHPVLCFSAVLAGLTVCSGAGAVIRFPLRGRSPILVLVALLAASALVLEGVLRLALAAPPALRLLPAFLLLVAPLGLLMGIPFPAGMENLAPSAHLRGVAWSVNGVAGVLSAVLAMQVALAAGVTILLVAAALCYLAAALLLPVR